MSVELIEKPLFLRLIWISCCVAAPDILIRRDWVRHKECRTSTATPALFSPFLPEEMACQHPLVNCEIPPQCVSWRITMEMSANSCDDNWVSNSPHVPGICLLGSPVPWICRNSFCSQSCLYLQSLQVLKGT